MKRYTACGLGNGIVDVLVNVTENEFKELGFERGTMTLVELEEQQKLLSTLGERTSRLVSGGSVGNSIIAIAQLGGSGAFVTSLGDDRYGLFYSQEAEHLNVELGAALKVGKSTGTCAALITPDAERTMRTCLGAASLLCPEDVSEESIRQSEWLFIEGYVFANPPSSLEAIQTAVKYALKHGTKIALTMSEQFIPNVFGQQVSAVLEHSDLVFCNEPEACALSGATDSTEAFRELARKTKGVVVTQGARGALVSCNGEAFSVPAFPCEPIDLLGAGDMFAGAFLYGICSGIPARQAARAACYLSMKVITRYGARIQTGLKDYWREGLEADPQSATVSTAA